MTPKELFDAIMDPEAYKRIRWLGRVDEVRGVDDPLERLSRVFWREIGNYSLAPESKPWDDEQWWADRFPHWVDWFYLTASNSWIHAGTSDSVETKSAFRETEEGCLHMVEANRYWRPGRKPLDEAFG